MSRIENAIEDAVKDNVVGAVQDPRISLESNRPGVDATIIARGVRADLKGTVAFLSNNEPWWQSWVTVGSIAPILAGMFSEVALIKSGVWDAELHAAAIVPVIGGFTALYGRWIARKPIGG